ncbi:hypothetical protein [Flexibacterium corallicola]|uniref:hypothetical protein n=1 Tax=Flexibacterium corallicola TaxID=3037259 RepID=UPI00286EC271|nr:hypothetical protein [Pseudovibrio sp. M1P-2-3]
MDKRIIQNRYQGEIARGVDYSPTWKGWVVGVPDTQTNDSDFANDAFQSLWGDQFQLAPDGSKSNPYNNGAHYRGDLRTLGKNRFNVVRLYNWNGARGATPKNKFYGRAHLNFLDYAEKQGLKVIIPVSDYFLSDSEYAWNHATLPDYSFESAPGSIQVCFRQIVNSIIDPKTGNVHKAVHSISVGNEGDIGEGLMSPPTSAANFLARTIWWIYNLRNSSWSQNIKNTNTPISATFSNADQGGNGKTSWFGCVVNGVSTKTPLPNGCALHSALGGYFDVQVKGLATVDPEYMDYYYNSINVSQIGTSKPFKCSLSETLNAYDNWQSGWPFEQFEVPLLFMEVFTANRYDFNPPNLQVEAALTQIAILESYLKKHDAGTSNSTTFFMGYNYFEFNDEYNGDTLNKAMGLFQYEGSPEATVHTGTTSYPYGPFSELSNMPYPYYNLTATKGPDGASLIAQMRALFPKVTVPSR